MRRLAYLLAVLFAFCVPWEAAIHIGAVGRGSKLLGLTAGAIWLLSALARARVRSPDTPHKWYFAFLVWCGLTFYWSIEPAMTWRGFITYTELFVMVFMFWDLCVSREKVETVVQAYVLGAFVAAGSIIANYVTAPEATFPAHTRINALGYQTDGIALIVAIAGPAAWYLAAGPTWVQRPFALRVVNFAYVPVGLMALVLTGTRGAALASIPTIVLVLWSLRHATGRVRALAVVAVACAVVLVVEYAPRGQLARIGTAATATELGGEGSALAGRWSIWVASTRVWLQHPITGVGVDTHRAAVTPAIGQRTIYKTPEKEAHNTYVSVLTETGIVGALLFGAVVLSVIAQLRKLVGWQRWYWSAQMSVLAIGAMSLSLEDSKSVWIFTSLCVAAAAALRAQPVRYGAPVLQRARAVFDVPGRVEPYGR
jgi:O-antigen ligase